MEILIFFGNLHQDFGQILVYLHAIITINEPNKPISYMRKLLTLILTTLMAATANAQLVINEIMQSNVDCIMDDINEFPDSWVELYNAGTSFVNTGSYSLGLTDNPEEAYKLPLVSLPPKAYFVVYCDKEGTGMHTNFRLESGKGGSIYLFNGKTVADSYIEMKKQPAPNISYGRAEDGGSKMGYMLKPTPSAANTGGVVDNKKILGEPVFSKPGNIYPTNTRVAVTLSLPEGAPEGTVIRYTLDGTEPTEQSPLYEKALVAFNSNMIIRAKLFCEGYLSPRSTTHSYIMLGRDMTIPVVSMTTNSKYFFDDKIGIYVDGTYTASVKNYEYEWRRPVNVEYFPAAGTEAAINQLCETRIQGGATRTNPVKSLAVYANKRFGEKRFTYEFFPTEKPGLTEFKSIILRNSGNDFNDLYFRDAAIQHNAAMNCDLDWQAWQPTAFFLNGEYYGLLNVRERSNEDNIYSNYDGLEDIDMIENWWELKTGNWDHFQSFKDFYTASANAENTNMDNYADKMDIDEFINLMAVNTFHANLDFPGNNIVMWRPTAEGGKWRWIMKDTDFGLGLYGRSSEYRYMDWLYNHDYDRDNQWANEYEHTRLFRRLMTDQRFKDRFIDRLTVFMGTFLNGNGLTQVIDSMNNVIKTEYKYHHDRLNPWWPNHDQCVNDAKNWAVKRTNFMWTYLRDYFKLNTAKPLMVNRDAPETLQGFKLYINDTYVKQGFYSSSFWGGREVRISAESINGEKAVTKWLVKTTVSGNTNTKTYDGSSCSFTMPTNATNVVVTPVVEEISGIESVESQNQEIVKSVNEAIYTLDGKKVSAPNKAGIYVIKHGNSIKKIIKN